MDLHRNSTFLCLPVHRLQFDFSFSTKGDFTSFRNELIGLLAGKSVDCHFPCGDILGSGASSDTKAGGNHAVQSQGSQCVPDDGNLRLGDGGFPEGNGRQPQFCSSGTGEILLQIGRNFCLYKEIAVAPANADVAYGFSGNTRAHQRPQKVPVTGCVALIKGGVETDDRRAILIKAIFLQIVRKIAENLPLCILVAAKGVQSIHIPKQKTGHLQLPGRQKATAGGDISGNALVYFVPNLGKQELILGRMGNFFDITAFHYITVLYYTTLFYDCKGSFPCVFWDFLIQWGKERGETMVVGIIGAGASGMAAAIAAAECENAEILLFERQARVGRKLQATGNGRCNLSNLHGDTQPYHGCDPEFVRGAMGRFTVEETLSWFEKLGLYTVTEESGRVYPYSDQANSVVDVLRFALEKDNIRLFSGFEVEKARKTDEGFVIEGNGETYCCDKLIIACGGLAGSKLGGSLSGYQLLRSFGHRVTKLRPALVQMKSSWKGCAALKGVRANCSVAVYHGETIHSASTGELQFTEYGLSGPVIFEVSRDVCTDRENWFCRLDFLPGMEQETLLEKLKQRKETNLPTEELFTGILHNRLGRVLTQAADIRGGIPISQLRDDELERAASVAKALDIAITEPMGMDHAQVTAGGIVTNDFNRETLESRLVPGLYACGEVLDIDGDCGGYNLQWAWSSGRLAGCSAGGAEL